jgi:hypothetical protein
MNDSMSPADYAAITGNNNSGFGGEGGWAWLIIILALLGGFNGNGFGGGYGGFGNDFAWLSNGQKEIMQNTNNGFDTLHLSNQIEGTRDAVHGISNQICNSTADVTSAITNGFYGAEIAANSRQMADMQQNFNLSTQLANCCCENRLANCQTQNIIQNEGNSTRFADANNTRDIITNATANTQAILDKLCQLELDGVKAQVEAKNDKIADLQRELQMADLKASQIEQTAQLRAGQELANTELLNLLNTCPIPSTPVYGRTPIFTCGNSCGCGGAYGNTIV